MSHATIPIDTRATTSSAEEGEIEVRPDATSASPLAAEKRRRVPLIMPSEQEYYWHFAWQQGEREGQTEREAGEVVRFDSDDPEDILDWLHEPEDNDDR